MSSDLKLGVRLATLAVMTAGLLVPTMLPAHAACHAFTLEVSPAEPDEGATTTVTIRRDAAVQPSSVRVRTVDGTATGGEDYTPLDERVEFSDGTEQQREVDILDDDTNEDAETFRIELSEAQGCEVNQSFTYDSATVTIQDDDPATAPSPEPAPEEPAPEPTETQPEADAPEDVGDLPDTGAASLVGIGLLGILGAAALRRRA